MFKKHPHQDSEASTKVVNDGKPVDTAGISKSDVETKAELTAKADAAAKGKTADEGAAVAKALPYDERLKNKLDEIKKLVSTYLPSGDPHSMICSKIDDFRIWLSHNTVGNEPTREAGKSETSPAQK